MASIVKRVYEKQLAHPPKWAMDNTVLECLTGSVSYGASNDTSDMDVFAVCIPPKREIFPHLYGRIVGFGKQEPRFTQWEKHHIQDKEKQKEYDIKLYNIVDFINLCMDNNPNMIDQLFCPRNCVLYSTQVGEYLRENRHKFLHKGGWVKFRGYAYSQMGKIDGKQNSSNPKRKADIEKWGYDLKFAMNVVRLLLEIEEIMSTGDLNLTRNSEVLKSIRRGEWSLEKLSIVTGKQIGRAHV